MISRTKAALSEVPGVPPSPASNYFTGPKPHSFVKSGCTLLDCALGGGWALGRVANIVGDKSTAKTALAVEAVTNFLRQHPTGKAAYRDAEAAFDPSYAEAMGLPITKVDLGDPDKPLMTMEEFASDLEKFVKDCDEHGIYVLDSLDALTTEDEIKRDLGDQGYGTAKAKLLSELFRKLARKVEQSKVLLIIVSQVRDNIGVMFGEKQKRSGGRALDFYASQIVWLARLKPLEKTVAKVKRSYGMSIRAHVKKNKVGLEHRKVDFEFHYGYGIEDVAASLTWLDSIDRLDEVTIPLDKFDLMDTATYNRVKEEIDPVVWRVWAEVEKGFLPTRRKYE